MKLTAKLALSQLRVNKRRTIWTFLGILLSTAMLTTIYNLGYGSGMDWANRATEGNAMQHGFLAVISGIAFIMSIFVICISVIVISNAFRVSATERLAQFGILKSTGATKWQIIQTVVYEGFFLTFIAIPTGILLGLLFQWISIEIINHVLEPMLNVEAVNAAAGLEVVDDYLFKFILSPFGMILSVGVSIFTVFLSAYLPAKKAAHVSAINAIRGTGEVKISNKKIHGGKLVLKLFKVEGLLARTFLKRSKKNFRATVIAITFSIAILIVAGSIHTQVTRFAFSQWEVVDADVNVSIQRRHTIQVDCEDYTDDTPGFRDWYDFDTEGGRTRVCYLDLPREQSTFESTVFLALHEMLTDLLRDEEQIYGVTTISNGREVVRVPRSAFTSEYMNVVTTFGWEVDAPDDDHFDLHLSIRAVDPNFHRQLAEMAGVTENGNILINHGREWDADSRLIDITMFNDIVSDLAIFEWDENWTNLTDTGETIEIHGMITGDDRPSIIRSGSTQSLTLIVPLADHLMSSVDWWFQTEDATRVHREAQDLLFDYFEYDSVNVFSSNLRAAEAETRDTLGLILFFLSAFVGVLILIALTNVISTISENVKTRSKEFAVLQSVGMTGHGIKRMLSLESIFASLSAIIIGVPLGILGSYGIFKAMDNVGMFSFPFPWLWIIISIIGVFLITWITMQFAAHKLKEQNIIETIRNGSGV